MRSASDSGFATITQLVATLLSMIAFTAMINVVVVGYGRGVVRAALDEGVRAGTRAGPGDVRAVATCDARVRAVLRDLLGGSLGRGVEFSGCALHQQRLHAAAEVVFPAWLAGVREWRFDAAASALMGGGP